MIKFDTPVLLIKNNTGKAITVLEKTTIPPGGKPVDVFKLNPHLSESQVIDAMRAPNGELYKEVEERRNLTILEVKLITFSGNMISSENLKHKGEAGQVLTHGIGTDLVWSYSSGGEYIGVTAPLMKEGGLLSMLKADAQTSGYLSKEDWQLFKGKSKGIKIWQYDEFDAGEGPVLDILSFKNGSQIPFNESFIIGSSAVVVTEDVKPIFQNKGLLGLGKSDIVKVMQHDGAKVVLNSVPQERFRVYFLIVLPDGKGVPEDYVDPPKYVRDQRIELIDSSDIDMLGSKVIRGNKVFGNKIVIKEALGINVDKPEYALDVGGTIKTNGLLLNTNANNGFVMMSNTMGLASWQANPVVGSSPPQNQYDGQLWMKMPEFELFVFDGQRKKWLSVNSFAVDGGKNSPSCGDVYLSMADNILSSTNAYTLPFDATLVGLSASGGSTGNWMAEVHVGTKLISGAELPVNNSDRAYSNSLNVDFREGDKIQIFIGGKNVSWPLVKALFRKRL